MFSEYALILAAGPALLPSRFFASGLKVDFGDIGSISGACKTAAKGLMNHYHGEQGGKTPGLFNQGPPSSNNSSPWQQAGTVWDAMINYQINTGDNQYQDAIIKALTWQSGPRNDFAPANASYSLTNEAQIMWALAAISAAESNFPSPPQGQPSWLDFSKTVFNVMVSRWDTTTCNGGLRSHAFPFSPAYNRKDAASNGYFFQLSARLAANTRNETYNNWAGKIFDWCTSVGLIDKYSTVYDSVSVRDNCSKPIPLSLSHTTATFLYGSAVMANLTNTNGGASTGKEDNEQHGLVWKNRTIHMRDQLLNRFTISASNTSVNLTSSTNSTSSVGPLVEGACEKFGTCTTIQQMAKGVTLRWLGSTMKFTNYTVQAGMDILQASSYLAAKSCSGGGRNGTTCGYSWYKPRFDGKKGIAAQMNAMDVLSGYLSAVTTRKAQSSPAPHSNTTSNDNSTSSSTYHPPTLSATASGTSAPPPPHKGEATRRSVSSGLLALCIAIAAALSL